MQDALDALLYVLSHPSLYDPDKITLSGFSAGANIALVVAATAGSGALGPDISIAAVASLYGNPFIGLPCPPAPATKYEDGMILNTGMRRFFYNQYLLPGQDRNVLSLSPGLADVGVWPKRVLVACGDADALWGHGRKLVEKLEKGGHKGVEWMGVEGSAHAFDKNVKTEGARAKRARMNEAVAEMIRSATREGRSQG